MPNIQLEHGQHSSIDKKYPVCFLAHDIDVPMNIGSLLRIADAFDIENLFGNGYKK